MRRTPSKNLNPTHLKKKISLKGKQLNKEMSKSNHLITDNPGTNVSFAYADVQGNLKICLKDAKNEQQVVKFANEKDFNNLFAKSF